jgi:uncharacterized HAD superfamily protein
LKLSVHTNHTKELTSYSKKLLENLTVTQLIKKFSAFHGTGTVVVSAQEHAMEFITKFSTDVMEYSDAFITRQFTFNKSIPLLNKHHIMK